MHLSQDPITGESFTKMMIFESYEASMEWQARQSQVKRWNASIMNHVEAFNTASMMTERYEDQILSMIGAWLDHAREFVKDYGQDFVPRDIRLAISSAEEELDIPGTERIKWSPEVGLIV